MKNICKNCFEKEATHKVINYKLFPNKIIIDVCDDCFDDFDPELFEEEIIKKIGGEDEN